MKCEICHKAEAETAVTMSIDGHDKELYVCHACAAAARNPEMRKKPSRKKRPTVEVVGGSEDPPPFVEELVKATLGFMKGVAEAEQAHTRMCSTCKTTWEKIKETGRIGCPDCWRTFAREIRGEFLAAQYGPSHCGSAPAVGALNRAEDARAVLARRLKEAIDREDYRRAAEIKHQLDALDGNGEAS